MPRVVYLPCVPLCSAINHAVSCFRFLRCVRATQPHPRLFYDIHVVCSGCTQPPQRPRRLRLPPAVAVVLPGLGTNTTPFSESCTMDWRRTLVRITSAEYTGTACNTNTTRHNNRAQQADKQGQHDKRRVVVQTVSHWVLALWCDTNRLAPVWTQASSPVLS